jgi:hypothetical protein
MPDWQSDIVPSRPADRETHHSDTAPRAERRGVPMALS